MAPFASRWVSVHVHGAMVAVPVGEGDQDIRWLANTALQLYARATGGSLHTMSPSYVWMRDALLHPSQTVLEVMSTFGWDEIVHVVLATEPQACANMSELLRSDALMLCTDFRRKLWQVLRDPRAKHILHLAGVNGDLLIDNVDDFVSMLLNDYFLHRSMQQFTLDAAQCGFAVVTVPDEIGRRRPLPRPASAAAAAAAAAAKEKETPPVCLSSPLFASADLHTSLADVDGWTESMSHKATAFLSRKRANEERAVRAATVMNSLQLPGGTVQRFVQLLIDEIEIRMEPMLFLLCIERHMPYDKGERAVEVGALQKSFRKHADNLVRGFSHFTAIASSATPVNALSKIQFLRLCQEWRILDAARPELSEQRINQMFDSGQFPEAHSVKIRATDAHAAGLMCFYEFVKQLFDLTAIKYPQEARVSRRMDALLDGGLAAFAQRNFDAESKMIQQLVPLITQPKASFVMDKYARRIEELFNKFKGKGFGVSFTAWKALLMSIRITTGAVNLGAARKIFTTLLPNADVDTGMLGIREFKLGLGIVCGMHTNAVAEPPQRFPDALDLFYTNTVGFGNKPSAASAAASAGQS